MAKIVSTKKVDAWESLLNKPKFKKTFLRPYTRVD
jgi:hypothetical protein